MKLFASLFGLVPLGVGLCVLGFVWSQPSGGFGGLPIFFKLFSSLVASAFVLTGLAILAGTLSPENRLRNMLMTLRKLDQEFGPPAGTDDAGENAALPSAGYACPSCGAPLASTADVSPHGDVKCAHCDRWFNIHKR